MTVGRGLPSAWTGPEWRGTISDLLELYQFSAARDVMTAVGASTRALDLAMLGDALLNLDVLDDGLSARVAASGPELGGRVAAVMWPAQRSSAERGPLADLTPTYELLLEVMHVHMLRGEWSNVLAVLHLMAEYLPLLAWSSRTGDAGDPLRLASRVEAPGAAWHTDSCPLNRAERGAFESVGADGDWDGYLRDRHSRIASALAVCAGVPTPVLTESSSRVCRRQCSVMDGVTGLAWRMTLVRRFRDSALLELRHDAPVGHFFSVPGPAEIQTAWDTTWHGLVADGVETPVGLNPATGMQPADWVEGVSGLLGLVAGHKRALAPATLLSEVAAQIRHEVVQG